MIVYVCVDDDHLPLHLIPQVQLHAASSNVEPRYTEHNHSAHLQHECDVFRRPRAGQAKSLKFREKHIPLTCFEGGESVSAILDRVWSSWERNLRVAS